MISAELKKDETLIIESKPHWINLFAPFFIALLSVIVGAYIGGYALFVPILFVLYLLYRIAEHQAHWWMVTTVRVVDESGIFSRSSRECPLDKVTNVTCTQNLLGRLIGFGDVEIQTAAEVGAITFIQIDKPREFTDAIRRMQEEYKSNQMREQAQKLASALNMPQQQGQQQTSQPQTNQQQTNATLSPKNYPNKTIYDELERLYDLKQKGILTNEEYEQRKQKLILSIQ